MRLYFARSIGVATVLTLLVGLAMPAAGADQPAEAARGFGLALTGSRPQDLGGLLPSQGKVQLKLDRLGPADGFFDPGQVRAIFADFLQHGAVRSFDVGQVESDGKHALARASARVIDRDGREHGVGLQLSLVPESGHWVIRGIKESPR